MAVTRTAPAKPVIAAIEGYCFGGGFELALWCDLRIASATAEFGLLNLGHGLPCLDMDSVRLPRIIGHGRAMDLILTARRLPATQALEYGLITRLTEPGQALPAALEVAEALAALPQEGLTAVRRSAIQQWALPDKEAAANETRLALTTPPSLR